MTHGSLFSGIGGFDLAAEWMGWKNIFHCEWNPFGQKVLSYYWPEAISYHDITKTNFTIHRGRIDILTGGFPCQPYSQAGKRKGKEDERHLWPEMLRTIREIQPRYVVGENVRGLTNWNGGMVFDEVQADLENQGYEILPFLLPACAVNAPHRRDRIWFIAYNMRFGLSGNANEISNGRHSVIGGNGSIQLSEETGAFSYRRKRDGMRFGASMREVSQLLPTVQTQGLKICDHNGKTQYMDLSLLPTPTTQDFKRRGPNSKQQGLSNTENWTELLPTPVARDFHGSRTTEALENSGRTERNNLADFFHQPGKSSQLNPRFVMEMMGFPGDWTLLPFQANKEGNVDLLPAQHSEDGKKNRSEQEETQ